MESIRILSVADLEIPLSGSENIITAKSGNGLLIVLGILLIIGIAIIIYINSKEEDAITH